MIQTISLRVKSARYKTALCVQILKKVLQRVFFSSIM